MTNGRSIEGIGMPTDPLDLLTDLLGRAKRAGADDADAVYFESA